MEMQEELPSFPLNENWLSFPSKRMHQCLNYELCGAKLPDWWLDVKGRLLCTNCDVLFGTWTSENHRQTGKGVLDIRDLESCPICMEEMTRGVTYPACEHAICLECFRDLFYTKEVEIEHPYEDNPEFEVDEESLSREELLVKYPKLRDYEQKYDEEEKRIFLEAESKKHLRRCCICRSNHIEN